MTELVRQIGIVGIGMIGASVAAAVKARGVAARVVAYSPGEDAKVALAAGWIDRVCEQASDCLEDSELLVLSAPVSSIIELMPAIAHTLDQHLRAGKKLAALTDTGSSKQGIIEAAKALGPHQSRFIAAHPIAGSERRGAAAANPDLFLERSVLLCPKDDQDADSFKLVSRFWQSLGARTAVIDPKLHDAVYAEVSHWPHAAAFALCLGIANGPLADHSRARAGAGLKDTTRIAASNPTLWADILLSNKDATLASAQRHRDALDDLMRCIEQEDRQRLIELLAAASHWRQQLQDFA
ncbi:MAG: prephenate dehydrogenase [Burkholderiales bacterium]